MKKLILIACLSVFTFACKETVQELQPSVATNNVANSARVGADAQDNDGSFELGAKLANPYSLKNMETALKELQKTNADFKKLKIEATHDYVRIEATTDESFSAIQSRKDIDLFRYPLDYEVTKSGNSYKEKDYTGKYQVFWAAVPVGYVFDKALKVKVLEKLFLPKGNGNISFIVKKSDLEETLLDALDNKSLSLFDPKYTGGKNKRVTANYVSGTIKVWDDYKQLFLPLKGLLIKGKRFFTTVNTLTNASGYYYINYGFNGPADITVAYEDTNFRLQIEKTNSLGYLNWYSGETTQNNVTGNWSINIEGISSITYNYFSADAWRLATTFRAAYDYYYKHPSTYGIQAPPLVNSSTLSQNFGAGPKLVMGIKSFTSGLKYAHTWATPLFQGGNHIIYTINPTYYYTSANECGYNSLDIYSTTIHEMTHAKHFDLGLNRTGYTGNKKCAALAESYAVTVEYRITMDEYNIKNNTTWHKYITVNREFDYRDLQNKDKVFFDGWYGSLPFDFSSAYTPYFIDMMDTYNQSSGGKDINETLTGISLSKIELGVKTYPQSWASVDSYLQGQYTGSAWQIGTLFNIYSKNK